MSRKLVSDKKIEYTAPYEYDLPVKIVLMITNRYRYYKPRLIFHFITPYQFPEGWLLKGFIISQLS